MNNFGVFFLLLSAILVVVAALAAIVGYFWATSKAKSDLLEQLKLQGDAIRKESQEQMQKWKDQELTIVRQQTYDAAKGQAIQEMQTQMQGWQENELQQMKTQIYDAAKGQATQEAAETIQRWQQMELQQAKRQISEAIRGEAIKEAQDLLLKWRSEELENARNEMRAVISQEAALSLEQWKAETEKAIRQDAITKSQSVTMGKMTEHFVPYLPGFEYNPKDARFIGSPVDLVIFDGLDEGCVRKIIFAEIKTGLSSLTSRERWVRDAVVAKNIEWMDIRANLEGPEVIQKTTPQKYIS